MSDGKKEVVFSFAYIPGRDIVPLTGNTPGGTFGFIGWTGLLSGLCGPTERITHVEVCKDGLYFRVERRG